MNAGQPPPRGTLADRPALDLARWRGVPRWCGRARPGVGGENPNVVDYAARETTPDQKRIEDALEPRVCATSRILHVGIGNSSLARRFAPRVARIVGLTVSGQELRRARELDIPNYEALLLNKYSAELAALPGTFDFVVDNNPASFGCCVGHVERMLDTYCDLLGPGGLLLTDAAGLDWCYGDGAMKLDFDDLQALGERYPLEALRLSAQVFALRRTAA